MTLLPAISLWQPWASLLFVEDPQLRKVHETRSWEAPAGYIRCRLAIHAAKRMASVDEIGAVPGLHKLCVDALGWDYRESLPRGAVIGTSSIYDVVPAFPEFAASRADFTAGNWAPRRFAWRMIDAVALPHPMPCQGRQGWFKVDVPAVPS